MARSGMMPWRFRLLLGPIVLASALSGCSAASDRAATGQTPEHLLELRLAYNDPAEGLERVVIDGRVVYIAADPVIIDADFESVRVTRSPGGVILAARCTEEASARLRALTAAHIGLPLAVLWKSTVRHAPDVQSTVGCTRLSIALDAAPDEAAAVAEEVKRAWPEGDAESPSASKGPRDRSLTSQWSRQRSIAVAAARSARLPQS